MNYRWIIILSRVDLTLFDFSRHIFRVCRRKSSIDLDVRIEMGSVCKLQINLHPVDGPIVLFSRTNKEIRIKTLALLIGRA
jgi:hypothetical protein